MASVVDEKNMDVFINNGITPVLPRNIALDVRMNVLKSERWVALSLKEFEQVFIDNAKDAVKNVNYHVCVDIANGHMRKLYDMCRKAKEVAMTSGYRLTIMTGNIANPETYKYLCDNNAIYDGDFIADVVVDYIRVSVGSGAGCITASNCACHYPIASLIDECYTYAKQYPDMIRPKIIADGGIRNYDHVIKALALGADYVMIGSLFAQCMESAGLKSHRVTTNKINLRFPVERYRDLTCDSKGSWSGFYTDEFVQISSNSWQPIKAGRTDEEYKEEIIQFNKRLSDLKEEKIIGEVDVKFFGMASADGQKAINGEKTKTSEGITKWLPVKYTLNKWTENMVSYLRSAMSYTNCRDLDSFIGETMLIVNSPQEVAAVNK
jgi:IMP dehydrogenase/GMP reductase